MNKLVQISIGHGSFNDPVIQFKRILKMISPEEITSAFVRSSTSLPDEKNIDDWNLHLYTKDTRISFYDITTGYYGDAPRLKAHKILFLAGFEVSIKRIFQCTSDFHLRK